jgi:hypothetical protein
MAQNPTKIILDESQSQGKVFKKMTNKGKASTLVFTIHIS